MSADLADVVVRARGLALHLLSRRSLEQLARCAGSGVLTAALQGVGYPPGSSPDASPRSAAEGIDDDIERETARRLGVLLRWLGPQRSAGFAGVFEEEQRRVLRAALRERFAGAPPAPPRPAWALPRRLRGALAAAGDPDEFARALGRHGSPYGPPLERVMRRYGPDLRRAEATLDVVWARRARQAADRIGGRLPAWVGEGIDVENAFDALIQGGGPFLPGGVRLTREQHAAVASEVDPGLRRGRLARVLGEVGRRALADREAPIATLESRVLEARIRREQRFARRDPLGAAPVLWFVLRLRRERADLRRINAGVALGLSPSEIAAQLSVSA